MSKISYIKIENLFGIKEFEGSGEDIELQGKKGVGKTSILDSLKYALTNRSDRNYLIRQGESEGEILIKLDNGLSIHRKARIDKADYKSIKMEGQKGEKSEGFIRDLFTSLQLDPIAFAQMTEQEQNRIILDMIDFKWDLNWIKEQFGEIVPEVDYEQNILCVLHDIQKEEGYYFRTRQDHNRDARQKAAFIEEIGSKLPTGYDASKWESINLGDLFKKVQSIRDDNDRITEAKNIVNSQSEKRQSLIDNRLIVRNKLNEEEKEAINIQQGIIKELEQKIKDASAKIGDIQRAYNHQHEIIDKDLKADLATLEGEVKQLLPLAQKEISPLEDLEKEAHHVEDMKSHINEYHRMLDLGKQVMQASAEAERLTVKIERARELPGIILETSKVPIKGLTIKDGIALINGLPISNLSEGEKFDLCIDVAVKDKSSLQLLLMDGVEKLDTKTRTGIYGKLKELGVQFIASRTTDDDVLKVVSI